MGGNPAILRPEDPAQVLAPCYHHHTPLDRIEGIHPLSRSIRHHSHGGKLIADLVRTILDCIQFGFDRLCQSGFAIVARGQKPGCTCRQARLERIKLCSQFRPVEDHHSIARQERRTAVDRERLYEPLSACIKSRLGAGHHHRRHGRPKR